MKHTIHYWGDHVFYDIVVLIYLAFVTVLGICTAIWSQVWYKKVETIETKLNYFWHLLSFNHKWEPITMMMLDVNMVVLLMPIFSLLVLRTVVRELWAEVRGQGRGRGRGGMGGGQVVGRAGHASLITILPYYFFTTMASNNSTPLPRSRWLFCKHGVKLPLLFPKSYWLWNRQCKLQTDTQGVFSSSLVPP